MTRIPRLVGLFLPLSACAGVNLSNVDDGHSLEYRTALPAVVITQDAECKVTSQVVSIPGPARYMSFKSGLGKADTSVDFGAGGIITKFNSKTEGQVDDALKIASAIVGVARGPGVAATSDTPKCKAITATYLIKYANGEPTVDMTQPLILKDFARP